MKLAAFSPGIVLYGVEAARAAEPAEGDDELLGRVEFLDEGRVEMGNPFGSELDGRLYTPLEGLDADSLVTPEERFYLRTRASRILPDSEEWTIAVTGFLLRSGRSRLWSFARGKRCSGST